MNHAQIIFCPYNYLLEPKIRDTMGISLKDNIVILDEAHNIEDCCRDGASATIDELELDKCVQELQLMVDRQIKEDDCREVKAVLCKVKSFLLEHGVLLKRTDNNRSLSVWSGPDLLVRLNAAGLGPQTLPSLTKQLQSLAADNETMEIDGVAVAAEVSHRVSSYTLSLIEAFVLMLNFIYSDDMKYLDDYRLALEKAQQITKPSRDSNGFYSKGHLKTLDVHKLYFWCLNPAVAFRLVSDAARCVVLSSGTLSPMDSFQSELGTQFPLTLEAPHIIKPHQALVTSVGSGPRGYTLESVYRNTESFDFQDELGSLIFSMCKVVPHGVLCFFPSYHMLRKHSSRWQSTGLWEELSQIKKIFSEPQSSDKVDFDSLMKEFYDEIQHSQHSDGEVCTGALFLAVCRGKISEGLDFADDNARLVITVGIPFPSIMDRQVEEKKRYNDRWSSTRGLLTGHQWYQIQAFRALNQALGRCLRHRNDWGAIVLVDFRFVNRPQQYTKGLSKWIRNRLEPSSNFSATIKGLEAFTQRQKENDGTNASAVKLEDETISSGTHASESPRLTSPPLVTAIKLEPTGIVESTPQRRQPVNSKTRTESIKPQTPSNTIAKYFTTANQQNGVNNRANASQASPVVTIKQENCSSQSSPVVTIKQESCSSRDALQQQEQFNTEHGEMSGAMSLSPIGANVSSEENKLSDVVKVENPIDCDVSEIVSNIKLDLEDPEIIQSSPVIIETSPSHNSRPLFKRRKLDVDSESVSSNKENRSELAANGSQLPLTQSQVTIPQRRRRANRKISRVKGVVFDSGDETEQISEEPSKVLRVVCTHCLREIGRIPGMCDVSNLKPVDDPMKVGKRTHVLLHSNEFESSCTLEGYSHERANGVRLDCMRHEQSSSILQPSHCPCNRSGLVIWHVIATLTQNSTLPINSVIVNRKFIT